MLKISYLVKFLNEINPHTSPSRLALYNYLKAFHSLDQELTSQIMSDFFYQCLDYPHWYANKSHFSHELQILLKNFNEFYQNALDIRGLKFPDLIQVIEVESNSNVEDLISRHLKNLYMKDVRFKLFPEQKKWLAFVLKDGVGIDVFQFDRKFTIRNGALEPLRTHLKVSFDQNMDLDTQSTHLIEISPHHLSKFCVSKGLLHGTITRGYMFQKAIELNSAKLHDVPKLFWPIKRIEQFFVTRESDPFYLDLAKKLEDIALGFWEKNSESWQNYMTILLSQAESALENVYIGDKHLEDLIRRVRHIVLTEKSAPWTKNQNNNPLNHL